MEFHSKAVNMSIGEIEQHAIRHQSKWTGGSNGQMAQTALLYSEALIIIARKYKRLEEQLKIMKGIHDSY